MLQAQSTFKRDTTNLIAECLAMHKDSGTLLNLVVAPRLVGVMKFAPHVFIDCERDRQFVNALMTEAQKSTK